MILPPRVDGEREKTIYIKKGNYTIRKMWKSKNDFFVLTVVEVFYPFLLLQYMLYFSHFRTTGYNI